MSSSGGLKVDGQTMKMGLSPSRSDLLEKQQALQSILRARGLDRVFSVSETNSEELRSFVEDYDRLRGLLESPRIPKDSSVLRKYLSTPLVHTILIDEAGHSYELLNTLTDQELDDFLTQLHFTNSEKSEFKRTKVTRQGDYNKVVFGEGKSGKVRLARRVSDGAYVAVKKQSRVKGKAEISQYRALERAISSDSHLMSVESSIEISELDKHYFMMPVALRDGDDVLDEILALDSIDPVAANTLRKSMACSLLQALYALHKEGFAHGDIKLANLLQKPDGTFLLADFGSVRPKTKPMDSYLGALPHMAPEFLLPSDEESYAPQREKMDCWAAGSLLLSMVGFAYYERFLADIEDLHRQGRLDLSQEDVCKTLNRSKIDLVEQLKSELVSMPDSPQKELLSVAVALMDPDPEKRISMEEALKLSYFV